MKLYFAPLEGITDVCFRQIHAQIFNSANTRADAYFTPFLSPMQGGKLLDRDRLALSKEENSGIVVIPQLMTNHADIFLTASHELAALGYRTVNLNLGCPSGTVVHKMRGSGFLADPDALDRFFDTLFCDSLFQNPDSPACMRISVKTRLGMFEADEFKEILEIYNRYPISELILHPRVRREMYQGEIHTDMICYTMEHSSLPLCCNGDLFTVQDVDALLSALPRRPVALMFGRGAVSNPNLFSEVRQYLRGEPIIPLEKEKLAVFSDALFEDACTRLSGERHILFRLKELWAYWIVLFENAEPYRKRLRKAATLSEFRSVTDALLSDCALCKNAGFSGNAKMNRALST